jgi:hypothetical protein
MVPFTVTAVVFLAALLIGSSLLWFYRGSILTHLGKLGMTLLVVGLASVVGFFGMIVLVYVLSMDNPKGPFALTLTVDEDGVTPEYRDLSFPKGDRAVLLVSSDRKVEVRFGDTSRVVRPGSPPGGGARIAFAARHDVRFEFFDARTEERLDTVRIEVDD